MISVAIAFDEVELNPMIDGWFALLAISFVLSVGELIVLLVQMWRDDAQDRNESGSLGRSTAGNRSPTSTMSKIGLALLLGKQSGSLRELTEIHHSLGSRPFLPRAGGY
jgi:hypothetical protein